MCPEEDGSLLRAAAAHVTGSTSTAPRPGHDNSLEAVPADVLQERRQVALRDVLSHLQTQDPIEGPSKPHRLREVCLRNAASRQPTDAPCTVKGPGSRHVARAVEPLSGAPRERPELRNGAAAERPPGEEAEQALVHRADVHELVKCRRGGLVGAAGGWCPRPQLERFERGLEDAGRRLEQAPGAPLLRHEALLHLLAHGQRRLGKLLSPGLPREIPALHRAGPQAEGAVAEGPQPQRQLQALLEGPPPQQGLPQVQLGAAAAMSRAEGGLEGQGGGRRCSERGDRAPPEGCPRQQLVEGGLLPDMLGQLEEATGVQAHGRQRRLEVAPQRGPELPAVGPLLRQKAAGVPARERWGRCLPKQGDPGTAGICQKSWQPCCRKEPPR
mmetsp:Transcript_75168/g.237599  ORF Transcript_75168/g.237599 Transcript_75168/m.237599 type:complete len:385 (+) Transcript_75168:109-1263(+)